MNKIIVILCLLTMSCAKQPGDNAYDVFLYYDHGCGAPQRIAPENMPKLIDDYADCKVTTAIEDGPRSVNLNCGTDRGIPRYFSQCNTWDLPYAEKKNLKGE